MRNAGRSITRQLIIFSLMLLVVLALVPGTVFAQSTPESGTPPQSAPEFVLEPVGQSSPFFTVDAEANTTKELTVALGNAGKDPVPA